MTITEFYVAVGFVFGIIYLLGLWDEDRQRERARRARPTNREIIRRYSAKQKLK